MCLLELGARQLVLLDFNPYHLKLEFFEEINHSNSFDMQLILFFKLIIFKSQLLINTLVVNAIYNYSTSGEHQAVMF